MTTRQDIFVSEYLKSGNATEAAINAGYSKKTAYSIGQRLLKNVEINQKIMKHREKISQQAELKVCDIVLEIRDLALNAKSETNRLRAYDMLMKHLGGYVNELKIIENLPEDQLEAIYQMIIDKLGEI